METEVELFLYLQLLQCYIVIGLYYTIEEGGARGWLEDTLIVVIKLSKCTVCTIVVKSHRDIYANVTNYLDVLQLKFERSTAIFL